MTDPSDLIEPVDTLHEQTTAFQAVLRECFQALRDSALRWEPRPMPKDWPCSPP